ncbi:MAG: tetratricopeptide repeat protein [Planctomycetota bacterium]|jgi:hypothetical protein
MIACRAFVIVGVLVCGLEAQPPSGNTMEADLERFREEQHKAAAREDRLHEMFYRHTLGLPVDVAQLFGLTKAEEMIPRARTEEDLRRTQQEVKNLITDYESLKVQLKSSQARLAKPGNGNPGAESLRPTRAPVLPKHPATPRAKPGPHQIIKPTPLTPDMTARPKPGRDQPTTRPSGSMLLIKGSSDRSLVGRVLYRSGKYESAINELLPITQHAGADISDLFHLALSYEKLARQKGEQSLFAKANDLFSRIEARDSHEGEDGRLVLGQWGRSARTSRQTMLWLLDKGEWKPTRDVSTIRWERAEDEEKQ